MNTLSKLSATFLMVAAVGLQAFPSRYIRLEPIKPAKTRNELVEILTLIDNKKFESDKNAISTVIGTAEGASYTIDGIGYKQGNGHINQILKTIKMHVATKKKRDPYGPDYPAMKIRKGDKIYAGRESFWYKVYDLYFDCANGLIGLTLVEETKLK